MYENDIDWEQKDINNLEIKEIAELDDDSVSLQITSFTLHIVI